jgi:hypothetical protein
VQAGVRDATGWWASVEDRRGAIFRDRSCSSGVLERVDIVPPAATGVDLDDSLYKGSIKLSEEA